MANTDLRKLKIVGDDDTLEKFNTEPCPTLPAELRIGHGIEVAWYVRRCIAKECGAVFDNADE